MEMDQKQLRAIFIDEALEHAGALENGLLNLEKSAQDMELLNQIFRAAHTIKGSSGMLGLKDLSGFTHNVEGLLDLLRQQKILPERDLISVLLTATDRIKEMVEAVAADAEYDYSSCRELAEKMEAMKAAAAGGGSAAITQKRPEPQSCGRYEIIFIPDSNMFKRGIDPSVIINDLKQMGVIESIRTITDNVPSLSCLDPEMLHLSWEIVLATDRSEEEIRSVFEFVEDGSEIMIRPAAGKDGSVPLLGQLLIEDGVVNREDVAEAVRQQKRLGEVLVGQGKATESEIKKALERQNDRKVETFKNAVSSTIRVDLRKLDHLINAVGEMVIVHSIFRQVIETASMCADGAGSRLESALSQLQRIGSDIQECAMSLRMLPVGDVFQRFTRLVRELSASKGKEIELVISGEDTELDKGVLEKISDPLVHLVRNAIDHGLETAEDRTRKGKPAKGTIRLGAYQMGDSVFIEVSDDGRGLNREKIISKAVSNGIIESADGLSEDQIFGLIFLPGFSTADAVTDISGRGVGMDVVKKNITALNGKVYIRSEQDRGTTISIKLPLTLAIIEGLKVLVGRDTYIIPITSVIESLRPSRDDLKSLGEKGEMIRIRGEYVPLIRLYRELGTDSWRENPWEAIAVLVEHERSRQCLLVDELLGEQQVVIKSLGRAMPKLNDIAGGTILGDGTVALVLDVPGLIERRLCVAA